MRTGLFCRRIGLVGCASAVLMGCASGTGGQTRLVQPEATIDSSQVLHARALADSLRRTQGIPGMAVAVAVGGKLVWSEGFGWADVERQIPANPTTQFRVGSISKLFTAAAAARLHERGVLDLDAPIQRYVPEFPASRPPITLRHLLGHLGGIRHYGRDDYINRIAYQDVRESLPVFIGDSLRSTPGEKYAYSSYGYNLLGAALQAAAGQEFRRLVQELVVEPLGMRRTVAEDARVAAANRAQPYSRDQDGNLSPAASIDLSDRWPSGGYLSTAEDLARFGAGVFGDELLTDESRRLMFTSQRTSRGEEIKVGWGWRIDTDDQGRGILHHGGSSLGGRAFLLVYPEPEVVVAIVSNLSFAEFAEGEATALADVFLQGNGSDPGTSQRPAVREPHALHGRVGLAG